MNILSGTGLLLVTALLFALTYWSLRRFEFGRLSDREEPAIAISMLLTAGLFIGIGQLALGLTALAAQVAQIGPVWLAGLAVGTVLALTVSARLIRQGQRLAALAGAAMTATPLIDPRQEPAAVPADDNATSVRQVA